MFRPGFPHSNPNLSGVDERNVLERSGKTDPAAAVGVENEQPVAASRHAPVGWASGLSTAISESPSGLTVKAPSSMR
jgi:hypothetical protein